MWARVAHTVTPMEGKVPPRASNVKSLAGQLSASSAKAPPKAKATNPAPLPNVPVSSPSCVLDAHGLDSGWDRKLARGSVHPDFTLDLHGASLDAAYSRLMHGIAQAKSMGARVILLVTGKPRPVDSADRGSRRGAIRAKVIDWLAASEHALDIAAIRNAHLRHGGTGALYIILKRRK